LRSPEPVPHSLTSSAVAPVKAPIWLLVLITISGTLAMHLFVPALPDAAQSFGASVPAMQATISVYIIGLATGQLVYGPLSDGLGRRMMLMIGLGLYACASLAAAAAPNVHTLIGARLFQALGGCAGLALGRAIVRDTAGPEDAVRDLALLNFMTLIGPGVAPLIGSAIATLLGWRWIFLLLAALGGATLYFTWRLLPQTNVPSGNIRARALLADYAQLLRSPSFMGFALGGACATTSIYAFLSAAPFVIPSRLHRPLHEVGIYLGLLMVGMSVGNVITRNLIRRVSLDRLLIGANLLSTVSAVALLVVTLFGAITIVNVIGLMFLFSVGAGATSPAALSKALDVDSRLVGSAAGLYGSMQMIVGALCTFAVGIGQDQALASATVLTIAMVAGQAGLWMALAASRPRAAAA
jgi:MFS transporter, DHA1 family, multidrug resistance protein